jgi:hypothetical protein
MPRMKYRDGEGRGMNDGQAVRTASIDPGQHPHHRVGVAADLELPVAEVLGLGV